jgi:nucleoside-diphosphate kinase
MLKPGVLPRRLVGEVLSRIERKGLRIIGLKMLQLDRAQVEVHYAEHAGKAFYQSLVDYTVSGPVVAIAVEGDDAIAVLRRIVGPTDASQAPAGTIRGDFALHTRLNIIHASDSPVSAARELGLYFGPAELVDWTDPNAAWF